MNSVWTSVSVKLFFWVFSAALIGIVKGDQNYPESQGTAFEESFLLVRLKFCLCVEYFVKEMSQRTCVQDSENNCSINLTHMAILYCSFSFFFCITLLHDIWISEDGCFCICAIAFL